jgi:adenylate cyclase
VRRAVSRWETEATRDPFGRSAKSPALAQILRAQSWRIEQLLNVLRASIWTSIGAITGGAEFVDKHRVSPGAVFALAWGLASALLGLTWLKRFYRYWISAVLSTLDITMLAVCMDAGHRYLLHKNPALVAHQLYASGIVLLALLASNALRFSWRLSLWSVVYGAGAYWLVLWYNGAVDVLTYVELMAFALVGVVLVYSTRKLGSIVLQVVERDALTRYLPAPVVDRIARDPLGINMQGEMQEVTALFTDLCGFTSMSETMAPAEVTRVLNEYLSAMSDEVTAHGGIPMLYAGDSLHAVFPETGGRNHARRAVGAALGMVRALGAINEGRRSRGLQPLAAGIGLHTGPAVGGPIGSAQLLQYTYIGDTVNTASRIEKMTRTAGKSLLVSGVTLEKAGGAAEFEAAFVGNAPLRGKCEQVELWTVTSAKPAV